MFKNSEIKKTVRQLVTMIVNGDISRQIIDIDLNDFSHFDSREDMHKDFIKRCLSVKPFSSYDHSCVDKTIIDQFSILSVMINTVSNKVASKTKIQAADTVIINKENLNLLHAALDTVSEDDSKNSTLNSCFNFAGVLNRSIRVYTSDLVPRDKVICLLNSDNTDINLFKVHDTSIYYVPIFEGSTAIFEDSVGIIDIVDIG